MVDQNDRANTKDVEKLETSRSERQGKQTEPVRVSDETEGPSEGEIEFVQDENESEGDREVDRRLQSVEEELERVRELYLRKLAEFDNFRRRVEREKAELLDTGAVSMVEALIPVLDNFERALAHAESESDSFREGVEMIAVQLQDTLTREGLEIINPVGEPFDPEVHDAVSRIEDPERPAGTVVEVVAKGYGFRKRLVRPAIVAVAVAPKGSSGGEGGETA